ncbi:hypothetical protein F5Y16DRAFT_392362 [Xylariaceae sp. FL0255]|nr:hypothetical protein F5Y16DRAFT_392362 [Xylariaceae sp. FL0255]
MSPFGSTEPTQLGTSLNLVFNCEGMEHLTRQIVNQWIWETAPGSSRVDDRIVPRPVQSLHREDRNKVASIIRIRDQDMTERVKELLRLKLSDYLQVKARLVSLLVAWEQVIFEKRRFDEEGFQPHDPKTGLSYHQFYLLVDTIWRLANHGQPTYEKFHRSVFNARNKSSRYPDIDMEASCKAVPTDSLEFSHQYERAAQAMERKDEGEEKQPMFGKFNSAAADQAFKAVRTQSGEATIADFDPVTMRASLADANNNTKRPSPF